MPPGFGWSLVLAAALAELWRGIRKTIGRSAALIVECLFAGLVRCLSLRPSGAHFVLESLFGSPPVLEASSKVIIGQG